MSGAIVITGSGDPARESGIVADATSATSSQSEHLTAPLDLSRVEILGRTALACAVETLKRSGVGPVAIVANGHAGHAPGSAINPWLEASQQLANFREQGSGRVLMMQVGPYIEFDPAAMLQCHQESGAVITQAFNEDGPLELWVVDPNRLAPEAMSDEMHDCKPAYYEVPGYVNRLASPQDLRRLVVDSLTSRCKFRPQAFEVRPGVWMGKDAQVERSARIVAPVYVGPGVKIEEECLITRCSNVESNSHIDFGTAIEDSSVLANSYVGIGLDLSHSIVDGSNLLNLRHHVRLEITDPVVMRPSGSRAVFGGM